MLHKGLSMWACDVALVKFSKHASKDSARNTLCLHCRIKVLPLPVAGKDSNSNIILSRKTPGTPEPPREVEMTWEISQEAGPCYIRSNMVELSVRTPAA